MPKSRFKESTYIAWRRLKAFCNSLCFYFCRIFPIQNDLVAVCTFEGKGGFGCNPKYIVQELHRRDPSLKFVWFVNDMAKEFPPYVRKVPNTAWSRAWWLSRSKVWIDNYRKPYGTRKRREQLYVNTWHATIGFKSIGLWRGNGFSRMAELVSRNDSAMIDRVVIDSEWCAEMYPKGMVYDGEFLLSGAPRCDILYGDRTAQKEDFRKKHGLAPDAKLVLFAPTFREYSVDGKRSVGAGTWTLDFNRLLDSLRMRFPGDWFLCIRVHPQLKKAALDNMDASLKTTIIDISDEPDMNGNLAAMDAFVTDYSSAAMEAGFCRMPVFIYADDIGSYVRGRGGMLWNLSEDTSIPVNNNRDMTPGIDTVLPYPVAKDNGELERRILEFDEPAYIKKELQFERDVKLVFDGRASVRVADWILEKTGRSQ